MSSIVRYSLLAAGAVLLMPALAAGQKEVRVFVDRAAALPAASTGGIVLESLDTFPVAPGGAPGSIYRSRPYMPRGGQPVYQPSRTARSQEPQWVIRPGEYGLELTNGMRMTGRPSKDWSARITTTFGTVTIPLPQIAHITPAANGQFSAYLKNGDRVTGTLGSNTMRFETKFGTLNVAATEIARLRSSTAVAGQPVADSTPTAGPPGKPSGIGTPIRGFIGPPVSPDAPPRFSGRRILRK